MKSITIKTEDGLKADAEKLFSKLGLNMTTAINVFLHAAVRTQSIPFELITNEKKEFS